ncbi:hypothetical protein D0817_24335 [Flavobacterium cupreum]|uniref:Uncharacterized protein n=1 Tax=Flavobacterium cupreum TaxID=2133766 RepID=A0A434A0D4_9FLAO|nr:hypothetical protein [Flavobacterium cupreum]RUT67825.1 hypothetical protein D0817_24335 [Flavobacterium cupreum]
MIINSIDKIRFMESDSKAVFYNQETNSSFGELVHNNFTCKIGWNSSLIAPKILEIESNIYSIGIDQNFAVIDFNSNEIILNVELPYFFYDTKIYKERMYICMELEILVLDKSNYSILKEIPLPDFYEEINFEDNLEIITCVDGSIIKNNI